MVRKASWPRSWKASRSLITSSADFFSDDWRWILTVHLPTVSRWLNFIPCMTCQLYAVVASKAAPNSQHRKLVCSSI